MQGLHVGTALLGRHAWLDRQQGPAAGPGSGRGADDVLLPALPPLLPACPQEEMFSFVTLAEDQNTKKGVVVLEA